MPGRHNLTILWFGAYMSASSVSLVMPFMPILLQTVGVTSHLETWTGVAFSVSFLTSAIFSPVWGSLADTYGRKPMLVRSGVGLAAVYLTMAFATQPWHIIALRFLTGALAGYISNSYALVATTTPPEQVGRALSIQQTAPAAGAITGPLVGGLLVQLWGIRACLLIACGLLTLVTLLTIWGVHESFDRAELSRPQPLRDLHAAWGRPALQRLFLLMILMQLGTTAIEPLITIYVGRFPGVTAVPLLAGLLFSLVGVATVIWAPLWGRVGERRGFVTTLQRGLLATAAGNALQLLANNLWVFGVVRFAIGSAFAAAAPALNTLVAQEVEDDFRGRAFGILTSMQMIGNMLGPAIGGPWGDAFGIRSNFGFSAVIFLGAWWLARGLGREVRPA